MSIEEQIHLTRDEMSQIVERVVSSRVIRGKKAALLLNLAKNCGSIRTARQIAADINSSRGAVSVMVSHIRQSIAGTGLRIHTFHGYGGGLMLVYAP